jgi:hypothetical protein
VIEVRSVADLLAGIRRALATEIVPVAVGVI